MTLQPYPSTGRAGEDPTLPTHPSHLTAPAPHPNPTPTQPNRAAPTHAPTETQAMSLFYIVAITLPSLHPPPPPAPARRTRTCARPPMDFRAVSLGSPRPGLAAAAALARFAAFEEAPPEEDPSPFPPPRLSFSCRMSSVGLGRLPPPPPPIACGALHVWDCPSLPTFGCPHLPHL